MKSRNDTKWSTFKVLLCLCSSRQSPSSLLRASTARLCSLCSWSFSFITWSSFFCRTLSCFWSLRCSSNCKHTHKKIHYMHISLACNLFPVFYTCPLTSSACFLMMASSFCSGVLSLFKLCIRSMASFPKQPQRIPHELNITHQSSQIWASFVLITPEIHQIYRTLMCKPKVINQRNHCGVPVWVYEKSVTSVKNHFGAWVNWSQL